MGFAETWKFIEIIIYKPHELHSLLTFFLVLKLLPDMMIAIVVGNLWKLLSTMLKEAFFKKMMWAFELFKAFALSSSFLNNLMQKSDNY